MEITTTWKPIEGFEGMYAVSSDGQVKSLPKKKQFGNQVYITKTKLLKPNSNGHDYLAVNLCKNHKRYSRYVHRLVANAFLPNPNNYPQINHKNENRNDNKVKNLEWCSCQYNINYGHRAKRYEKARGYRVGQFTPTGVYWTEPGAVNYCPMCGRRLNE